MDGDPAGHSMRSFRSVCSKELSDLLYQSSLLITSKVIEPIILELYVPCFLRPGKGGTAEFETACCFRIYAHVQWRGLRDGVLFHRDECDVLESEICRKEYAIANGHPLLKQFMPDCRRLPVEQSIEHRKCIRLGLRPSKQSRTTNEDCFTENGTTYSGKIKQTVSGGECKKWDSVNYPDFAHHNYCRNPGGVQSRPWCHNNKDEAVELCSLPKCGKLTGELPSVLQRGITSIRNQNRKSAVSAPEPGKTIVWLKFGASKNSHTSNEHQNYFAKMVYAFW